MAKKIYNISIAGCGKVAHIHARAIKNITNARLAGVWSRTPETAKNFASIWKTKPYSDIKQMVLENESDLVIVCTPHPFHRQPAVEAAEAGANVLVEKPIASDMQDCDAIINACKVRYGKLGVISQRRWYEPVKRVRAAIDAGIFGKVHVHGENGASVGVQTDGGAMFIAGMTGVAQPPVNDLWTVPGEEKLLKKWVKEDTVSFGKHDPVDYYMQCQIEDFLKAIEDEREPAVSGDDGRRVVELFSAIYRSTRDNAPVKFPLKHEPGQDGRQKL